LAFDLDDVTEPFVQIPNKMTSSTMAQKAPKPDPPAKEKPVSQKSKTNTTSTIKADNKGNTPKVGLGMPGVSCPCNCGCDELNITFTVHKKR